ncbi:hypothetical protein [Ekhidna sp.]|uniref:hypothetical protein n=1 Tax=Ekhidna sp. TaxID=2608089 RepID=UPI003CCBFF4B
MINFRSIKKQEVDINLNINVDVTGSGRQGVSASVNEHIGKVETDMSVAQLAYFCRIMYDLQYFQNKNQTEMLKVAANNFTTANAQDISLKSLKAKYYSTDNSTKASIKKRLLEMLNYVNRKEK